MALTYMKLKYGSYNHDAPLIVSKQPRYEFDGLNRAYLKVTSITATGKLYKTTPAAYNSAINSLVSAYASDHQDLFLYYTDAATITSDLNLSCGSLSAGCIAIHVTTPPHAPTTDGPAYANGAYWPFTVGLEVLEDVIVSAGSPNLDRNVIQFKEDVQEIGGEDFKRVCMETTVGLAKTYNLVKKPKYIYSHQGSVTGWFQYPDVPAPLSAAHQMAGVRVRKQSPKKYNTYERNFQLDFSYVYESAEKLVLTPRTWV